MIVIVVLGIIATLTIPALVNKNKESVAKTKLRKAMAAYESALNKMIIENDLKDNKPLTDWANTANCPNTTNYFKKVQGDGCIFKTSDGIWWNISDIERPVISFKEITAQNSEQITANANNENDKTAFVLVGRFGNDGSLRVDDLAYETANSIKDANNYESKAQVEKLYTLLGLKSSSAGGGNEPQSIFSNCDPTQLTCTIDGIEYTRGIIEEDYSEDYDYCDPEDWIDDLLDCGEESDKWKTGTSESKEGTYWITNVGGEITWYDAKAACADGTHLATLGELKSLYNRGDLKCQDGSHSCSLWAVEESNPDEAYSILLKNGSFNAREKDSINYRIKSTNGTTHPIQVLCLGN